MNKQTITTLQEAKDILRAEWNDGVECPCCTQFVKLYKRKITSSMAYALILIYKYFKMIEPGAKWVHMNDYLNGIEGLPYPIKSGDNAKLRYWDLMREKTELRSDGSNRAGYWQLTDLGRAFVEGNASVLSHAKVFNSKCYAVEGKEITIREALGEKFNYTELMK